VHVLNSHGQLTGHPKISMYVCMCVCMYICTYVCMYVCTYVCMYICTYVHMYVCMYVCTYICMYVCYNFLLCAHLQHSIMIQLYCICKQWVNSLSLECKIGIIVVRL
jgi:hypothetical protein